MVEEKKEVSKEEYDRFIKSRLAQRKASLEYYYRNRKKILEKMRKKYAEEKKEKNK